MSIARTVFTIMGIIVGLAVLFTAGYYGLLFYAHDFDPAFLRIDHCLDQGGTWNDEFQECDTGLNFQAS